ncbi:MAG: hypothetical protein OEZ68_04770 [Gammaproteobacteria bacterium]|nr:hypothetical protein [Gammaproteobacteria bacterium]MDH5800100.1 hypothetical protein [Gammaproteobacteria bacterium]
MPKQSPHKDYAPQIMGKVIPMPGAKAPVVTAPLEQAVPEKPLGVMVFMPWLALLCSVVTAIYVVSTGAPLETDSVSVSKQDALQSVKVMERKLIESREVNSKQFKLEDEALRIVQTDDWTEADILSVALAWQRHSYIQQKQMRETLWFQLMENGIVQRLQRYATENKMSQDKLERQRLLIGLAANLSIELGSPKAGKVKNQQRLGEGQKTDIVQKIDTGTVIIGNIGPQAPVDTAAESEFDTVLEVPNVLMPQHEISHAAPELSRRTSDTAQQAQVLLQRRPTAEQLQHIAGQFVQAYESGDISKFTALFTLDATNNNESSLNAIKAEYEQLFLTTSGRQMALQGLKWSYSGDKAVGKARLVVSVTNSGDRSVHYAGRIQFVVVKQDNEVLISRLFHLIQANQG